MKNCSGNWKYLMNSPYSFMPVKKELYTHNNPKYIFEAILNKHFSEDWAQIWGFTFHNALSDNHISSYLYRFIKTVRTLLIIYLYIQRGGLCSQSMNPWYYNFHKILPFKSEFQKATSIRLAYDLKYYIVVSSLMVRQNFIQFSYMSLITSPGFSSASRWKAY